MLTHSVPLLKYKRLSIRISERCFNKLNQYTTEQDKTVTQVVSDALLKGRSAGIDRLRLKNDVEVSEG